MKKDMQAHDLEPLSMMAPNDLCPPPSPEDDAPC